MVNLAEIGFATRLLELAAASIAAGIVVAGAILAMIGMFAGWSRKEMEASAWRISFAGSIIGICCLCYDLVLR